MKLYIERNGSGWGGYYACYIVDLENKKYSRLANHNLMGSFNYAQEEKLAKIVELSNCDCERGLEGDYSGLANISGVTVVKTGAVVMDAQEDAIYLVDNKGARLIWSPMGAPFVETDNKEVNEILRELVDEVEDLRKCIDLFSKSYVDRSKKARSTDVYAHHPKSVDTSTLTPMLKDEAVERLAKAPTRPLLFTHHAKSVNELAEGLYDSLRNAGKSRPGCVEEDNDAVFKIRELE